MDTARGEGKTKTKQMAKKDIGKIDFRFTKEDLIDAFWWGYNFRENTLKRNYNAKKLSKLTEKAIENMLRDKGYERTSPKKIK